MEDYEEEFKIERDFLPTKKPMPRWRRFVFGGWILFLVALLVIVGGLLIYKTGFTFSQMQTGNEDLSSLIVNENIATPTPESDRTNILLLGLRSQWRSFNRHNDGLELEEIYWRDCFNFNSARFIREYARQGL